MDERSEHSSARASGQALEDSVIGCILGTAAGDAFGLPCEGLSRKRQARMFPRLERCTLFWGKRMVSDDTEHTCIAAQSVIVSGGDPKKFQRALSRGLRIWLLFLPGGIGLATLRALLKLSLGFGPEHSGVFSAGNGPAMRSALLGVCFGDSPAQLQKLVRASTRLTHTDPKAEYGAMAVALAAWMASRRAEVNPEAYLGLLTERLPADAEELIGLVRRAGESARNGQDTDAFAANIGCTSGVSGYVYQTVPIVLHVWFCCPNDFRYAIETIVRCGGDTDTTAAILGGILGACVGKAGIPSEWVDSLWEQPCSAAWLEQLGRRLAGVLLSGVPAAALPVNYILVPIRNIFFLGAILTHGFRRLLPPY